MGLLRYAFVGRLGKSSAAATPIRIMRGGADARSAGEGHW